MIGVIFSNFNKSLFWELVWNNFGVRELAEKVSVSPAKVSLFFSFLIRNDLAVSVSQKNKKIVSLNRNNPFVHELITIIVIERVLECSCFFELKKSLVSLLLFGSCASGTCEKMSDIDLCVVSKNNLPLLESSKIKHCFSKELGREVNVKFYTKDTLRQLQKNDKVFYTELSQKSKLIFGDVIE